MALSKWLLLIQLKEYINRDIKKLDYNYIRHLQLQALYSKCKHKLKICQHFLNEETA